MTGVPNLGVSLARLALLRKLDVDALSSAAAVPESELAAVLDGAMPSPSLLRRLAPALHLHTSDLFVIAGLPVPDDLAPTDPNAQGMVASLVWTITYLPQHAPWLRELVRSLPQEARIEPSSPPPRWYQYPPGPGALVLRLLHNRNLSWVASAKCLYLAAGVGPLSGSTVGLVGRGKKELSPDLLAGFATVLGVPAGDLAALTGVEPLNGDWVARPVATDVAELIWDARRLTVDQIQQVADQAHGRRHAIQDDLSPLLQCHCALYTESRRRAAGPA